ncbi:MAG: Lrp/AsnC family transcriptional regulator [Crenarchaeota archaeon]|nr:MAG: Lrp/AsnC family transcriptional regulator [Thermoproteota archaeon]RDJ34294.1 MAG: Lrp/AsnC family transcriptional regulator [Thermoproteota archaeon]RDJ36594.1 MAG: Lrp/AsnC family transcriptional regulator [Thermoproteota archaeon]RDJ37877.1 MAG: Lrp/AsnC family transcriptional regulator [Thermoproteota archaeon]
MPTTYFLLNVTLNQEQSVIDNIKNSLSEIANIIFDIQGVFGVYDIVLKVTSDSEDSLRNTVMSKIRSIQNIQSSITMIVNE